MSLDLVVEKLEAQHVTLLRMLTIIADENVDYEKRLETLQKSKQVLLAHLKQEDDEFYPIMRAAAQEDQRLQWLLDIYDKIMESAVAEVLNFYALYEDGWKNVNRHKFSFDLQSLIGLIRYRIEREESKLYPEYKRIQSMPKKTWFKKLFSN